MADGSRVLPPREEALSPEADGRQSTSAAGLPSELLLWLSPAFPAGGFAFSHGLERLAQSGEVANRDTLAAWIVDLSRYGGLRNDLVILASAHRSAREGNWGDLDAIAELAAALQPSAERRLESLTQGGAFADAIDRSWPGPATRHLLASHEGRIAYPVAVAASAADNGVAAEPALEAYAVSVASALVSAAIRLSLIGQFDGQGVLRQTLGPLRDAARASASATLDDLGSGMFLTDIASMEHETQYTRLFRS